jgi:glycosyltransferase involved in cell wall biosynthesis
MMNSMRPEPALVSCVMATTPTRRRFLKQAVKYFLRQTYAPKELVVVDDSGEPSCEAIASFPGIRYLHTGARLTLGSKLNLGIAAARGDIIQKLDDDDYYHPEFLSATVSALRAGNQPDSIVALTSCLVLIVASGELKILDRNLFAGGTFCFFMDLWRKGAFRDLTLAEDHFFLKDHMPVRIGIDNAELYCLVRHGEHHAWSHFPTSDPMGMGQGPVLQGGDVTEYLQKLPAYSKTLDQYFPEEAASFYKRLAR